MNLLSNQVKPATAERNAGIAHYVFGCVLCVALVGLPLFLRAMAFVPLS